MTPSLEKQKEVCDNFMLILGTLLKPVLIQIQQLLTSLFFETDDCFGY